MAYGECDSCQRFAYLRKSRKCYKCDPSKSGFRPKPEGIPGSNKVSVRDVNDDLSLFAALKILQANGASFRQMAKWLRNGEYSRKITAADIKRILDGKLPKSEYKRKQLRLPALVPVPACPTCLAVHTHAHDEQVYNPTTHHPAKNRTYTRRPRNYPGKLWVF